MPNLTRQKKKDVPISYGRDQETIILCCKLQPDNSVADYEIVCAMQ